MASQSPLLEDLFWRSPEWADSMGGIHENTVLFYFAKSPFFDPTSNNASLEAQSMYNQDIAESLSTRQSFEAQLDTMSGTEYRVHLGPMDFGPEAWINAGRWVVRKQRRRIDYSEDRSEVEVLTTYFVVGISIYMAPSLSELLTTRLLSTTSTLAKLTRQASSHALFSPSQGHHYLPPNLKPKTKPTFTPDTSREASLAPETSTADKATRAKGGDLSTLLDAYHQFNAYSGEYTDENPLLGEPGNFVFSNSREHVQARREAEKKREAQATELKKAQEEVKKAAASRAVSEVPKAETPYKERPVPSRKGSRAPEEGEGRRKAKRRKSRAPGTPASFVAAG